MPPFPFRSLWISDLHLGTKNQQNEQLLDFLLQTESGYLYLVGDILDLLQAQKKWYWPQINDRIVQTILAKTENGTKVFYIPGNHDHMLRQFSGRIISGIHIRESMIHETADSRRYLVMHGDRFDPVVQHLPWLAGLGSLLYEILLQLTFRRKPRRHSPNRKQWSLSAWMKHQVKIAVQKIGRFDQAVVREVSRHQAEGLICGHIHKATIREMDSILYINSGDWVESCTALAENQTGRLGIIEWRNHSPMAATAPIKSYEDLYRDRCLASTN